MLVFILIFINTKNLSVKRIAFKTSSKAILISEITNIPVFYFDFFSTKRGFTTH